MRTLKNDTTRSLNEVYEPCITDFKDKCLQKNYFTSQKKINK